MALMLVLIMEDRWDFILHQILLGYQGKDDEIGETCWTHGRDEKFVKKFWS